MDSQWEERGSVAVFALEIRVHETFQQLGISRLNFGEYVRYARIKTVRGKLPLRVIGPEVVASPELPKNIFKRTPRTRIILPISPLLLLLVSVFFGHILLAS